MAQKVPNPHSPEEVRRAFQRVKFDTAILSEGALGEILVGAGVGVKPTWTTDLTTLTSLVVDNITINAATITSDTGAISFGNENLTTTGTIGGINVTSGNDPGHTHSIYTLVDGTRPFTGTVGGVAPVANSDLTTKLYVDTAIAGATDSGYEAVIDADGLEGQVVYMLGTGHLLLAYANDADAYKAVGLLIADADTGETANFYSDQYLTLADWSNVASTAALTPGAVYYLNVQGTDLPDYANDGGTGDRTASITITRTIAGAGTDASKMVNGLYTTGPVDFYLPSTAVAGKYLRFDFGVGTDKWITECKWYQDAANTHGIWQWQGSDDAVSWTDVGSPFTLGGTLQTQTELAGNAVGYRYYQLLGISGTASSTPFIVEVEFKIIDFTAPPFPGRITSTKPSGAGVYVVEVGRAVSKTMLDIEIKWPGDHGDLLGLADDDHTSYHTDARAATWLAANHETTYNHANYDIAYGWGDHAGLYDAAGTASGLVGTHESTYNHANYNTAYGWGDHAAAGYVDTAGLTATRLPYASDTDTVADSANLTFDGTILGTTAINLPVTTSTTGVIKQNGNIIFHTFTPVGVSADYHNIFIGKDSGNFTLTGTNAKNVGLGRWTLYNLTTGHGNMCVGYRAGRGITEGYANVCIGQDAGLNLTTGLNNMCIGSGALSAVSSGNGNVGLGVVAGQLITTGHNNTCVGYYSGYNLGSTSAGICIGFNAGRYETAGAALYIDSVDRSTEAAGRTNSLIYGKFNATPASQYLAVNGQLEPLALTAGRVVYSAAGTVNAKLVDSANLTYDGSHLQSNGYKSADGSAGVSGSFTTVDSKTVTVKDGLITAIV